jgi:hypothetical protein
MKRNKLTALLIGSLLCSTAVMAQEQLSVPLSNPGKPYTLEVHILSGSIKIGVTTSADIQITATARGNKNNNSNSNSSSNGMRKLPNNSGYEIIANENNNVINVSSKTIGRPIDLELKVPTDVKLKLHTVNSGDIEVENIKGEIEIGNVDGSIRLINVSGSAVATTVSGNVKAIFTSVDSKAAMAFTSLSGNVDVTFPASIACNLKLRSDMGEIYSDFDIAIDKSDPKVQKTNEGGMHKLAVDDWMTGKINGGGPEIMMKNMSGNIYIRKAK